MATSKKLASGDNVYETMAVHPSEPYIMVGGDNSKVNNLLFLASLFWSGFECKALQIDDIPRKRSNFNRLSPWVSFDGFSK